MAPCSWAQHDYTACAQPGHSEDQRAAWGMKMPQHPLSHLLFLRAAPKSEIPLALLWFMFTGHKAVLDPTWHPALHWGSLGLPTAPPVPQAVGEQSPFPCPSSCLCQNRQGGGPRASTGHRWTWIKNQVTPTSTLPLHTPGLQCPLLGLD